MIVFLLMLFVNLVGTVFLTVFSQETGDSIILSLQPPHLISLFVLLYYFHYDLCSPVLTIPPMGQLNEAPSFVHVIAF